MNMGMETIVPDLDELIVALFLYVLIPFGIPLVAGIISAHRMPPSSAWAPGLGQGASSASEHLSPMLWSAGLSGFTC